MHGLTNGQSMDEDSTSSEEIQTGTIFGSQALTLPEISVPSTNTTDPLTPSLWVCLAKTRPRTIETEFGTIVMENDGIKVHSKESNVCTRTSSVEAGSPGGRKISIPHCDFAQQESSHLGGSRMILFNPAKTESRILESVTERKLREERGVWCSDNELLTVACSFLVGVSTLLHMPNLCVQTSGGAFLLMYALCLLLFGAPLLLLEAALGQFSAHGMAKLMPQMAPALKGYSYAMLLSLVVITATYMPIVSGAAVYGVEASRHMAAWTSCSGSYNSPLCYTHALDRDCQKSGAALYAGSHCLSQKEVCQAPDELTAPWNLSSACVVHPNQTVTFNHTRLHELRTTAGEEFFHRVQYAVIPWLKEAQAAMVMSLLFCWTVVALISQGGADSVRYSIPFVIGAPLIIVVALTITMMMHSNQAAQGAWSLLAIDAQSLANPRGWLNAAKYTICSHGTGLGVNAFIYSRNMLTHDCKRSVLTLVTLKLAISTLCVVCYAFLLGAQAANVGEKAEELNDIHGHQHALVQLTSALGALTNTRTWSVLMLIAIVLVGIGSVQILLLTIETSLRELDLVPSLSTRTVVILLCAAFFVVDAAFTIPSNYFTCLSIYEQTGFYFIIVMTFALVVAVNSTLGVRRLLDDVRDAMAVPMRWSCEYWRLSWRFTCPLVLFVLFFGSIIEQAMLPLQKLPDEVPGWTLTLSGVLAAGPLMLLLGFVFEEYRRSEQLESKPDVFVPTARWRPGLLIREQLSQEQLTEKTSHALMTSKPSLMTHVYSAMEGWSVTEVVTVEGQSDESVTIHRPPSKGFVQQ